MWYDRLDNNYKFSNAPIEYFTSVRPFEYKDFQIDIPRCKKNYLKKHMFTKYINKTFLTSGGLTKLSNLKFVYYINMNVNY